ncbi:hypothetical protein FRB96_000077 [Tulasnella sp. 330]|nr:hypothetical protein FRB96_000077 [Tulasnella sp. 330]KAG8884081.1 hypothetical protein FRB97_005304 [Tulasnella sp. 331]KAG8890545.1 hypothetical protein FRB98_007893 [Tulasnella sp. 332]
MQPGTGLPANLSELHNIRVATGPRGAILCQINALTDIGHSAFSLQNVRQTRIDRADLAGLVEAGVEDEEESQPIPNYPRATLRMDLSDGSTILPAMEYKRLPGLQLGITPLGCKILIKNVMIRRGIAFLEPANVEIYVGSQTEEREAVQDRDFARSLRVRLGKPEEDPAEELRNGGLQGPPPSPPPTQPVQRPQPQRNDCPLHRATAIPPSRGAAAAHPTSSIPTTTAVDDSFDYFHDDSDDFMDEDLLKHLAEVERGKRPQGQPKPEPECDFPDDDFMGEDLSQQLDELERKPMAPLEFKVKKHEPREVPPPVKLNSNVGEAAQSNVGRSSSAHASGASAVEIISSDDEDDKTHSRALACPKRAVPTASRKLAKLHAAVDDDIIEISD